MKFQAHNLNQGLWRMKDEGRRTSEGKGTEGNKNQDIDTQGINQGNEIHSGRENQERRVRKYHPDEKKEETWGKKMKKGRKTRRRRRWKRKDDDNDMTFKSQKEEEGRGRRQWRNSRCLSFHSSFHSSLQWSSSGSIMRNTQKTWLTGIKFVKRIGKERERERVREREREGSKETDKKEKIHSIHFQSGSLQSFSFFPLKSSIWVIVQFKRNSFLRLSFLRMQRLYSLCPWIVNGCLRFLSDRRRMHFFFFFLPIFFVCTPEAQGWRCFSLSLLL